MMSQPIKTSKAISYNKLSNKSWAPSRYIKMPEKPDDVDIKELQEVAYINPESRFFKEEEINIEDMKLIQGNSVDKKTGKILFPHDIEKLPERARLKAQIGDILYPLLEVSNPAPVPIKEENYLVSDYFGILAPKNEDDLYYLIWALRQEEVIQQIKAYYQGAISLRVKLDDLRRVWIPWHEKDVRKEKAEKIKEELSKTTAQEEALDIKESIDLIFSEHFNLEKENFASNPHIKKIQHEKLQQENKMDIETLMTIKPEKLAEEENLAVYKIDEIAAEIDLGLRPDQMNEQIKKYIIKTKSIYPMKIEAEMEDFETEESLKLDDRYILNKGDFLIVTKGGRAGTAALVTEKQAGLTFHNSLAKITVDEEKVLPKYLAIYLNSFIGGYYIKRYARVSTTIFISKKQLLELPVLLPSMKEQEEMADMI